ncbi:alpha/beta hydrolase [Actinocorallia sp. API 0066]|uniref:alpha/beta hydrolase n=1 Tax=Actinocorallia sp. API 0066 TaxID=2896846 RepID=UPI001E28DC8A|nr:alpha/beta hydrolase [Actinocorallia sp. API 0066]MCD0452312.1 alpha/beta hydrolase [Actinocorallia sp. API 0066]
MSGKSWMRACAAVGAALAVTMACTTTDSSAPSRPAGQYTPPPVAWKDCGEGFQCGTLDVPVDYGAPDGRKIALALIKIPATGAKQGSLVTNPGGPGGSGVNFIRTNGRAFGESLRRAFDIIGFDPRGVGKSSPVECLTDAQLDAYLETDMSPDDDAEMKQLTTVSQGFAEGCQEKSADILPYVSTRDAARDMDAIRVAVGDSQLTYWGASYGTYLGAWYAEQFPQNVRALVLDGALDPTLTAAETNIQQAKGFETALRAFTEDCVKQPDCPLGTDVDAGMKKVTALLEKADRQALKNTADSRDVDQSLVAWGLATPLYQKAAWPLLRGALAQAMQGDGTTLLRFADLLVEREQNGTFSSQTESNMAVNCLDKPSSDLAGYKSEAEAAAKAAPNFGEFIVWNTLPCAFWPVKATEEPRALRAEGSAPILVVGTTRDPATPYQWSKNLASQLANGHLLTYDGDGHTAYLSGPPCIRNAVDTYLTTLTLPPTNTTCT